MRQILNIQTDRKKRLFTSASSLFLLSSASCCFSSSSFSWLSVNSLAFWARSTFFRRSSSRSLNKADLCLSASLKQLVNLCKVDFWDSTRWHRATNLCAVWSLGEGEIDEIKGFSWQVPLKFDNIEDAPRTVGLGEGDFAYPGLLLRESLFKAKMGSFIRPLSDLKLWSKCLRHSLWKGQCINSCNKWVNNTLQRYRDKINVLMNYQ